MEIYILDALLRRIDLVDEYESFIWTERYAEQGDCELIILSTPANRNRFVFDTLLSISDSKRLMSIISVEEIDDQEKGKTLRVKGLDLVAVFRKRVLAFLQTGDHPGMIMPVASFVSVKPLDLAGLFVSYMCTSPFPLSAGDEIPFLQDIDDPSLYPASNIPEPEPGGIYWEQKVDTIYNAIVDVSKAYDTGFRLYKDPSASKLYFEAYQGTDRTTAQSMYPPVVFSSDMANLQSTTEYKDNLEHFNVVVAIYQYTEDVTNRQLTIHEIVSDPELAFSSGGFDQKTKFITITQLPEDMTLLEAPAYLQQLASEELTRSRPIDVYDGEVDQNADFVYERDYNLGDIVEVRGDNGGAAYMRVVEQIIKYDANGKASYPSLVTKSSITPGTWKSWKYDVDWVDMGSGEYWSNQ